MPLNSINSKNITTFTLEPNNILPIDITGMVTQADATYSSVALPEGGISYVTGSLVLTQASVQIDFDDRYNEIFTRGSRIKSQYAFPENPGTTFQFPIIGTTYITGSNYDFKSTLTLDIGCVLSLLNFLTPEDLGICVEVGSQVDVWLAIVNLLKAAGVYDSIIDEDSFSSLLPAPKLVEPLPVAQGSSIIQEAAKLAGQHGTFIYQDNNGIVRLSDWKRFDNKGILFSKRAKDLHAYNRASTLESKVKRLTLTYAEQRICEDPTLVVQNVTQNDIRTEISVTRDDVARTITRVTTEYRTFNAVESLIATTTEVTTYEPETAASDAAIRIGDALPNGDCYPSDPGRILSKLTTTVTDNTNILSSWASVKASAIEATAFNVSGVITSKVVQEVWDYSDPNKYTRQTTIFTPKGYAVPIIGDRAYRRPADPLFADDIDPTELVIQEQISELWERTDDACVNWRYTKQRYVHQYAEQPEIVAERALDTGVALQTIADEAFLLVPVETEILNNASEPRPDTYPPAAAIGTIQNEVILGTNVTTGEGVGFGANYGLDVVERKFLGNFFNFPTSEIELIGKQYMDIKNGRILGVRMADSLFSMGTECWSSFVPFFLSKIIEPYRTDRAGIFVADTPTISINPEETVIGWFGIFLGFNTNLNNPFDVTVTKTPVQPITDAEVFLPPAVNSSGTIIESFEAL